jgi:hypothetical protein
MALICTTDPVTTNYAEFEDDETQGHDQGALSWGTPFNRNDTFHVTVEGYDVEGSILETTFDSGEVYSEEPINPGKVVIWILKKIGELVCPNCGVP